MKNEFYKLKRSHIFYLMIFLSVITMILFAFYYYDKQIDNNIYWYTDIEQYNSKAEVIGLLDEVKKEIDALNPIDVNYELEYSNLKKVKDIYEYLSINYVPYNKIIEYDVIQIFNNNNLAYTNTILSVNSYIIFTISIIFALYFINLDFLYGTQKKLYTRGEKRTIIIKNKYLLYLSVIVFITLLLIGIGYAMGFSYHDSKPFIILTGDNVRILKTQNYIILNLFSIIFNNIIVSSIIFYLAVLIRKFLSSLVILFAFSTSILFIIPMLLPDLEYLFLFMPPMNFYAGSGSLLKTVIFIIIKLASLLCIMFVSLFTFNKGDLL